MSGVKNTIHTTDEILLQGKDAFDPIDWDPDSSMLSIDESPKPDSMKPQLVTYTTVGSLVNPKTVHQFAAPNRIQREGANRRPLMSIIANRPFDSIFQTQDPPPPLNMSNSMHYTQHLSRNQSQEESIQSLVADTYPDLFLTSQPDLSPFSTNNHSSLTMRDQEQENAREQFHGKAAMFHNQENLPMKVDVRRHIIRDMTNIGITEGPREAKMNLKTHAYGMEKMQTLQRLSKFKNPMQEWARSKLSGFSVVNQPKPSSKSYNAEFLSYELYSPSGDKKLGVSTIASDPNQSKFEYYSPITKSQRAQANPMRGDICVAQLRTGTTTCSTNFPQPLIAGPPGQRQINSNFSSSNFCYQEMKLNDFRMTGQESTPHDLMTTQSCHQVNAFQLQQEKLGQDQIMPWTGHTYSNLVDTVSEKDAAKYYPYSWPNRAAEVIEEGTAKLSILTDKQSAAKKLENLDNWFYSGQRRFARIIGSIISNESCDQNNGDTVLEPISLPEKLPSAFVLRQISVAEINRKPISSCVAPLIDCLLDTLLEYSDKEAPDSRAKLSNFAVNQVSHLDATGNADSSLFDQDNSTCSTEFPRTDSNVESFDQGEDSPAIGKSTS